MKSFKFVLLFLAVCLVFACKTGKFRENETTNKANTIRTIYWDYWAFDEIKAIGGIKIPKKDDPEQKHGIWIYYVQFSDGQKIERQEIWENDTEKETIKIIYEGDTVKSAESTIGDSVGTGSVKAAVWNGSYKYYLKDGMWITHKDGKLFAKSPFKDGVIHGVETGYDDKGIKKETPFINGKKNGVKKVFKSGGAPSLLENEEQYTNDVQNGFSKTYHPDGKTVQEFLTYKNDIKNGPSYTNYEDGSRESEGSYAPVSDKLRRELEAMKKDNPSVTIPSGSRTGRWVEYTKGTRKISSEGNYIDGERTGPWKFYHDSGNIAAEGSYVKDAPKGVWSYYNKNKQLIKKVTLDGLFAKGYAWFYDAGKLMCEGELSQVSANSVGDYKQYWYDGALGEGKSLVAKGGSWKDYYPGGKLKLETLKEKPAGRYNMGKRSGKFKEYYENGNPKLVAIFRFGKKEGFGREYYQSGKVAAEGEYSNDKKNGVWYIYNENGALNDEKSGFYVSDNWNRVLTNLERSKKGKKPIEAQEETSDDSGDSTASKGSSKGEFKGSANKKLEEMQKRFNKKKSGQ